MVKTKQKITEETKQQLKKLTRKYFIKQKILEVTLFILIIILIMIVLPSLGYVVSTFNNDIVCSMFQSPEYKFGEVCIYEHSYMTYFLFGLCSLLVIGLFVLILLFIIVGLYNILKLWISSNHVLADKRARKVLGILEDDTLDVSKDAESYY